MIITSKQASALLGARKIGLKSTEVSLDFNRTKSKVIIEDDSFIFGDGVRITEKLIEKILKDQKSCFLVKDGALVKIQMFSEQTNRYYKFVPTDSAPTIEISGIRMHVTKGMSPLEDASKKIESISPITGFVLDTCMGLGYTAILASKTAQIVITCEKDQNVIEMARINPWSKEIFDNKKISVINTSVFDEIKIFKSEMFDFIIHDPPRLSLATELYSQEFYRQIFRILKRDGRLYHYIGTPGSKNRNINLASNVSKRLKIAGFKKIFAVHYGLAAFKS